MEHLIIKVSLFYINPIILLHVFFIRNLFENCNCFKLVTDMYLLFMCACKLRKSIHNIINIFLYFYRLTNEETRKIWEESGDPDGPGGKICFMVWGGEGDPHILFHEQRKKI